MPPEPQKKRHTLLTFGYCGTRYFGLQNQGLESEEPPTVAAAVRAALLAAGFIAGSNFSPLARTKWDLASRTDRGVHACCAAASVKLETRAADVEPVGSSWQLSTSAIERINSALAAGGAADVRVFSGSGVRKRFSARDCASSRTYEYLVPLDAVGAAGGAAEFDRALRTFEGTHRFHNFASGLREREDPSRVYEGWPLAVSLRDTSSSTHRSVLTCRVHREVEVEGVPYLVLRVAGLAFVLHQIRHMVGAALAVSHGLVPRDVLLPALSSPLKVDVAPLAPGAGLLLDSVEFFDLGSGEHEVVLPREAREAMEAYKEDTLYPHIHSALHSASEQADAGQGQPSSFAGFVESLRAGRAVRYSPQDYDRLRRAAAAYSSRRAEAREEMRAKREERRRRELAAAGDEPRAAPATLQPSLPSGLLVALCTRQQVLPGPGAHAELRRLRAELEAGDIEPGRGVEYYVDHASARETRRGVRVRKTRDGNPGIPVS